MSQQQSNFAEMPGKGQEDDLEKLLLEGVTLEHLEQGPASIQADQAASQETDNEEDSAVLLDTDIQGALGLFAEASQDMSTTVLELNLGRHFACADYCNQVAEKAAQAVSLRRFGRRTAYNHDLRALGAAVGAPPDIQDEMALLTPFHPETFYADTPPEEADEVISAEQARGYTQSARKVLRWARSIVLAP
jgi:HEPN domain-containing protein